MRQGLMILVLLMWVWAAQAAESYSCFAVANPDRGYPQDMQVQVAEVVPGGSAILRTNGQSYPIGEVASVYAFDKSKELDAFVYMLGMYQEADVSGLSASQVNEVNKIEVITLRDEAGPQILKYFIDDKQVGGTLTMDLHATKCIPLSTP